MISDASNAFVQWRYVFDYETNDGVKVNPQFLRGFRFVLRDVCCQEIEGKSWSEKIKSVSMVNIPSLELQAGGNYEVFGQNKF